MEREKKNILYLFYEDMKEVSRTYGASYNVLEPVLPDCVGNTSLQPLLMAILKKHNFSLQFNLRFRIKRLEVFVNGLILLTKYM